MSDETILLPCPFCGCDPWEPFSTKWTNCIGDMSWSASVHCPECEITVKTECVYETAEAAIEAAARKWNTRATVGNGACELVTSEHDYDSLYYHAFSCGHDIETDDEAPPSYCPECGAKVVER